MGSELTFIPMAEEFVLWRCLHGGALDRESVDTPQPHPQVPWEALRARNVPLLRKLANTYGAYAVAARDGDRVVGQLRFYPRAIRALAGSSGMCMQQGFPAGPPDGFAETDFLPLAGLADRTLSIHCVQVVPDYQGRGVCAGMLSALIAWAQTAGWQGIHSTAIRHIQPLLRWSGALSVKRLQEQGFAIRGQQVHADLKGGVVSQRQGHHGPEAQSMWDAYADLSDDEAAVMYEMELDLREKA